MGGFSFTLDDTRDKICKKGGTVMEEVIKQYYEKRAQILIKNMHKRHFEAYYCATKEQALEKALELIPEGASVGWGGALSAKQIGLVQAIKDGNYQALDRDLCKTPEEQEQNMRACFSADFFLTGANGLSMDGQMVNIDGTGNRVAAIAYGPKNILVIAGMNKVEDTVEDAVKRARTVAAPMNHQRFPGTTPCTVNGVCGDCLAERCICNQFLITRNSRIEGRIKFILVGEELGL